MVAANVPIAALAPGVRSSARESRLGGGSGGNGKSSPGVNPGGRGVGAGVGGPPVGGAGVGPGSPAGGGVGLGAGVGPPVGGVGAGVGVGFGLPGGVVSGGVISSPRTRYQSFLTGVTLEPSPWTTKYLKVPPSSSPLNAAPPGVLTTSSAVFTGRSDPAVRLLKVSKC